jgi:hypothetical protein
VHSLSLRPADSLTTLKDGFVDGLQVIGFPDTCHPSYRALTFYPGGTDSHRTHQPSLDTHPGVQYSRTGLFKVARFRTGSNHRSIC